MSEAIGQPDGVALPRPMGIGEILSTTFRLHRRPWRTLLAIAAVVVIETTTWSAGIPGLVLLILPGIYIGVRLAVSIEALVVEDRRGHRGHGPELGAGRRHWWHAVATVLTLPYGVLLCLDLRARRESLNPERLRADLQASAA
jgi:hypothetical protein